EAAVFETVERRIERRGVEADRAVGALVDQAADLIAVALPVLEQGEDEDFRAPTLELSLQRRHDHMWRDYISSRRSRKADGRTGSLLGGHLLAVLRGSRRRQRVDQPACDRGRLLDREVEGWLVRFRGLGEAAQLADELQRGVTD